MHWDSLVGILLVYSMCLRAVRRVSNLIAGCRRRVSNLIAGCRRRRLPEPS